MTITTRVLTVCLAVSVSLLCPLKASAPDQDKSVLIRRTADSSVFLDDLGVPDDVGKHTIRLRVRWNNGRSLSIPLRSRVIDASSLFVDFYGESRMIVDANWSTMATISIIDLMSGSLLDQFDCQASVSISPDSRFVAFAEGPTRSDPDRGDVYYVYDVLASPEANRLSNTSNRESHIGVPIYPVLNAMARNADPAPGASANLLISQLTWVASDSVAFAERSGERINVVLIDVTDIVHTLVKTATLNIGEITDTNLLAPALVIVKNISLMQTSGGPRLRLEFDGPYYKVRFVDVVM